jgi:predicted flap endonuclease-1-like 5' DNA nuclease
MSAKTTGILLMGHDKKIEAGAKAAGLAVVVLPVDEAIEGLPFEKTLLVEPGTAVPWDLLPAAWHFLDRWDAAVPLWRYGVLAADVGTKAERQATEKVVGDLRVLLHAVELLFVRRNEMGQALLAAWDKEMWSDDKRLAFLRAVCQVKPRLCVLPRSWLAELRPGLERTGWTRRRSANGQPLTTAEIAPGRLVKCHLGDEAAIKKQFDLRGGVGGQSVRARTSLIGADEMAIVSSKSFEFVDQQRRMEKGPLVRVDLGGGRMVKMYEADAIAGGHLPGKEQPATGTKSRPPREDKSRPPQGDKADDDEAEVADFAGEITGVGPAAQRALAAAGITTFEQLRTADVERVLSGQALKAVEAWREADG